MIDAVSNEQLLVKRIVPQTGVIASTLIPVEKPAPLGVAAAGESSLQRSTSAKAPVYRPEIPALPTAEELVAYAQETPVAIMYLLACLLDNEKITALVAEIYDAENQNDIGRIETLNQQLKIAMAEHFKADKKEGQLSVWQNVFQDVFSAMMIGGGSSFIAKGIATAVGVVMVVAGALGLVNRVMTDTGIWKALVNYCTENHQIRQQIAARIESAFYLLGLAIGFTASSLAYQAGLHSGNATAETARRIATLVTSFLGAATQLMIAAVKDKNAAMRAQIVLLTGETTDLNYDIQHKSLDIESIFRTNQRIHEIAKESIQCREIQ